MSRENRVTVQLTVLEATMLEKLGQWAIDNDGMGIFGATERRAAENGLDKLLEVLQRWERKGDAK